MTSNYYLTPVGSRVEVTDCGRIADFDWFEENACIEARRCLSVDATDPSDAWLCWHCDCCGGGQARLTVTIESEIIVTNLYDTKNADKTTGADPP